MASFGRQLLLPRGLLTCEVMLCLLFGQLGAQAGQRGAVGLHRGLLDGRVDLQQQVALGFTLSPGLHSDVLDLARHLRTHVHVALRLQHARAR